MSLRLKLVLLIGSLFIAGIGNVVFMMQLDASQEEKLNWVIHTNTVVHNSDVFLSSLKDIETGQRGYLLTNRPSYLQPYHSGLVEAVKSFQTLKDLTQDNPDQQKRLDTIGVLMELKFAEMAETVKLARELDKKQQALDIVMNNKGKEYMDNIRIEINKFNNAEAILLESRKGDYIAVKTAIATLIIVELALFIFLAVFTFVFLRRSFFQPLDLLLSSTKKAAKGERLDIADIVQDDEMGYLLSRFFTMNETIQARTTELDYKAHHDELTGLSNRIKMLEEIEAAVLKSKEDKAKFSIFFIDLNEFKSLNDTLGHEAGDSMLIETAKRIKDTIRGDDSVFRIGGDEFVVLINNIQTKREVQKVLDNILKAAETPLIIQGKQIKIKMSIGVVVSPDDATDCDELLRLSDVAMYAAKRDKDTQFKFYEPKMLKRASDNQ